jgi:hypothetical protein
MSVDKEIEAVKFHLGTFFGSPLEHERTELIIKQFEATKNEHLKTYAYGFSVEKLVEQLYFLQGQLSGE